MTHWYVKDLSKLTSVTVQTLHHYDKIGLLTPSLRGANGYWVYSEKDLVKLQQIIALKFFGFELSHIKRLLDGQFEVRDHFALQAQWNDLMTDMHGHDQAKNQQFMNILMTDPRVSEKARQLLKG